jgi:hypothetical protein
MTYEQFTAVMRTLKHAMQHIRNERGSGNCQDAIARNRALETLKNAEWHVLTVFKLS